MADMSSRSRKLSINLSLFTSPETPAKSSVKSPKNFERPNGVVGLGILAAMDSSGGDEYCSQDSSFKKAAILAISPRSLSNPIPILSNRKLTTFSPKTDANAIDTQRRISAEEVELCEEYTCVISHFGDNQTKKKEYFDNVGFLGRSTKVVIIGTDNINGHGYGNWVSSGVVSASFAEPVTVSHVGGTPPFPVADFLNSCFLCKKRLDGLDIFMYRGEKAFCSADCRCQQISIDEHKEKYVSGTMKPPLECSASPCSSPLQFFAGVAAA